jgi:hypothetical protein
VDLDSTRVEPYLRALRSALFALAPHDDYVPLAEVDAHLQALSPVLSGKLLFPAEIDDRSGLPAFTWLERAIAEQVLAGTHDRDLSDAELSRARGLDAHLATRMGHRRALHRFVRDNDLLPASRLHAAVRRFSDSTAFIVTFDRVDPMGLWTRIRLDISTKDRQRRIGPLEVTPRGLTLVDEGLKHLLSRHGSTPLTALHAQISDSVGGDLPRLSRSSIGPFWFPGFPHVQQGFENGLIVHASTEVIANDIRKSVHNDPWIPAPEEHIPNGFKVYRERRFAATSSVAPALHDWGERSAMKLIVVPLRPG